MSPIISSSDGTAKFSSAMDRRFLPEPLRSWSGTSTDYPRAGTVVTLFENIVRENPDKLALIQGHIALTYGELNQRANRIAHRLRLAGSDLGSLAACCF